VRQLREADLLTTPLLAASDPATVARVTSGLQSLLTKRPHTLEELKEEFHARPPLEQLVTKKVVAGRREAKRLEKERQMMELKYTQGLTPAQVARRLKVGVEEVYKATARLKTNLKKALTAGEEAGTGRPEYFYKHLPPPTQDPTRK